jgi:hypothetical protein
MSPLYCFFPLCFKLGISIFFMLQESVTYTAPVIEHLPNFHTPTSPVIEQSLDTFFYSSASYPSFFKEQSRQIKHNLLS